MDFCEGNWVRTLVQFLGGLMWHKRPVVCIAAFVQLGKAVLENPRLVALCYQMYGYTYV